MIKKLLFSLFLTGQYLLVFAQSLDDEQKVLQMCIDNIELQSYLQDENGDDIQELYIMDCGNKFGEVTDLNKFSKSIVFVDKKGVANLPAYLQFYIFEINGSKARVDYKLIRKSARPNVVHVFLELIKEDGNWVGKTKKIEEK